MSFNAFRKQCINLPPPKLTEKNLPNQLGRVFIVTGGYAGVGEELSKILYGADATVMVAGRSPEKGDKAISAIKAAHPDSKGKIEFLLLDLNDLSTIKTSVTTLLEKTDRVDVLVNNAGVMFPPSGTKNKQGHDMQFSTNCIGPFLFTKLLIPTLEKTAAISPKNSVRVVWAGSLGIQALSPKGGGLIFEEDGSPKIFSDQQTNYGATKTGNLFLGVILQNQLAKHNIVSTSFNPGNLKTELQRHSSKVMEFMVSFMLFPAIYGAYTELWAACSEELTVEKAVKYVAPWGIAADEMIRSDVAKALDEGAAQKFWDWCEKETSAYI